MNMVFYKVCNAVMRLHKGIIRRFWMRYNVQELKCHGVFLTDTSSVRMYGKHVLRIGPHSEIKIGRSFISRSSEDSGIETTITKILVAAGAHLTIGDSCGISNATIICNKSITIGNHVLIGGGND